MISTPRAGSVIFVGMAAIGPAADDRVVPHAGSWVVVGSGTQDNPIVLNDIPSYVPHRNEHTLHTAGDVDDGVELIGWTSSISCQWRDTVSASVVQCYGALLNM